MPHWMGSRCGDVRVGQCRPKSSGIDIRDFSRCSQYIYHVRKRAFRVLIATTLLVYPGTAEAADQIDYADTVLASVDQATLSLEVVSPNELAFTLELLLRRNRNPISRISAAATTDLPSSPGSPWPYECQRVSVSLTPPAKNGNFNPSGGRPYSFISEWVTGDRVVEHHKLVGVVQADSGKKFCLAPIRLVDVSINDIADHWLIYRLRTDKTANLAKPVWTAYSEFWFDTSNRAPCKSTGYAGEYEPCLNSDLSLVRVNLTQSDLDEANQRTEEARKIEEAKYQAVINDYLQKRAAFLAKVTALAKKYPGNSDPITAHRQVLEVSEKLWEADGRPVKSVPALLQNLQILEGTLTKTVIEIEAALNKKRPQSTISCYKGKLIRKITGINPKCPTGFSRK